MKRAVLGLTAVACAIAHGGLALFDFEDGSEARIVAESAHGDACATNICATSGARALWMGPHGEEPPEDGYAFATVSWTDSAKNDWSRFDRLVFDATNLSGDGRNLVLYLYDAKMRKSTKPSRAVISKVAPPMVFGVM